MSPIPRLNVIEEVGGPPVLYIKFMLEYPNLIAFDWWKRNSELEYKNDEITNYHDTQPLGS